MRVLVACEFSAVVRDAFRKRGHDAWSVDLLPTEGDPAYHHEGRVEEIWYDGWDLMIGHPPCTFLCNSGVKHLYIGGRKENGPYEPRWKNMVRAADFFCSLLRFPIRRICVENPVMHRYAKSLIEEDYAQTVQPRQFGHGECKRTCLWLKNLPPLVPTDIVEGRAQRIANEPPGKDRWKKRSITYQGIADAMAEQWGDLPTLPQRRWDENGMTIRESGIRYWERGSDGTA